MSTYRIEFTKSASEDLKSIQKYIYENNRSAAREVVKYVIERIETLIPSNPSVGKAGRVLGTRELVITKYPYIVPYKIRNNTIYILRVLHTSRSWEL